ncbi:MAG: reverse gyrase, partial [Calditrichaeota bacterium]
MPGEQLSPALEVQFQSGCPNCGGPISSLRLEQGLWCPACGKTRLEQEGRLPELWRTAQHAHHLGQVFSRLTGRAPWQLQQVWLLRLARGESFATTAPTGLGKTTFGLFAAWMAGGRRLVVVPTRLLVVQARQRLAEWSRRSGKELVVLTSLEEEDARKLPDGQFDVFVTTGQFLHRNVDVLAGAGFGLIFLDDVDSFLKSHFSAEKLLRVAGFSQQEIASAHRGPADAGRPVPTTTAQVIASSATLKPRPLVLRLFVNLLGFSVQPVSSGLRNVQDVGVPVDSPEQLLEKAVELAGRLPTQGMVFVSQSLGRPVREALKARFLQAGLNAALADEQRAETLVERFRRGELRLIVAPASPTHPVLRGLDLPRNVTYTIFLEVPKREVFLEEIRSPGQQYQVLAALLRFLEEKGPARNYLRLLRRYRYWTVETAARHPEVSRLVAEVNAYLQNLLSDADLVRRIGQSREVLLRLEEGRIGFVWPDAAAYIQGSGRSSRILGNRLTFGLSFLIYQDEKAFAALQRRLRIAFPFLDSEVFQPLESLDWQQALAAIEQTRRESPPAQAAGATLQYRTTLLLVESPSKARTIAGFFGQPVLRRLGTALLYEVALPGETLTVAASLGHLYDLVTLQGFFGVQVSGRFLPVYDSLKICPDSGEKFTDRDIARQRCPDFQDRQRFVEHVRPLLQEMDQVLIATDPDAEGEKIAWDLSLMLRPLHREIYRVAFHEVTPQAIRRALNEKQQVQTSLVAAQLVRRIADRWVGFTLSQHLWQVFQRPFFSAGRVQTPVLGWVIERNARRRQKVALFYYRLNDFPLELRLEDLDLAERLAGAWERVEVRFVGEALREQAP